MPLQRRSNPVSIDYYINRLANFLFRRLKATWPISDGDFEAHGRVYRNQNDKGFVPNVFIESTEPNNTQYVDLAFDKENQKGLFFFNKIDQQTFKEGSETVKVELIFVVNLSKLKPKVPHRSDEEVLSDVRKFVSPGYFMLSMTGEETGFSNVFRQFNGLVNKDGEVFEDRHPLFCFKFNLELMYQPAEVICN